MLPIATLSLLSALTVAPVHVAQSPNTPAVANILPADTPLVGLVNTKAADWGTLRRFQLFQTAAAAGSQLLPPDLKFNYAEDVESWLGDQVAVVFMPKTGVEKATIGTNFLILAPVKDDKRLQPFLATLKADTERQYKGIRILEWKAPQPAPVSREGAGNTGGKPNPPLQQRDLFVATLPGYIVTANTSKPIEQLIDFRRGNAASLMQNRQFQQAIQQPQANQALFTLYENPAKLLPLIKDLLQDPSLPFPVLPPESLNLEQLKEYSTVDGFLSIQPQGLRFEINAYRQVPKTEQLSIFTAESEKILTRMPAATYSAFTGRNLNQQWQSLISTVTNQPELEAKLAQLRNFIRTRTGLDLDRDILGWMDGEYALFLFPTKGGVFRMLIPNFNLGIGLVMQTNKRLVAENTLQKLEQFVKSFSQGLLTVNTRTVKGQPVTSWDFQGASESLLAYSWVDNNTITLTTGLGAIADLVPQPYVLLPNTYNFTTAIDALTRPNEGYFYVNMGSFLSWVYGFIPSTFNDPSFRTFKAVIGSVYSLSATSSITAKQDKFDGLVVLAPTRKQN